MFKLALFTLASAGLRQPALADVKHKLLSKHGVSPTKDEACAACVEAAGQTPTWTQYCQCFVTNSNKWGSTSGGFSYETESVEDRYYWNCGAAGGEGFTVCKASTGSLYGDRGAGSGQEEFTDAE